MAVNSCRVKKEKKKRKEKQTIFIFNREPTA